jgi:hypothetical protein
LNIAKRVAVTVGPSTTTRPLFIDRLILIKNPRNIRIQDLFVLRIGIFNDVEKVFIFPFRDEEFVQIPDAYIVGHTLGVIRAEIHLVMIVKE